MYHKALAAVKDWPESIANSWIDFERDEGNLEHMEVCETKTRERLNCLKTIAEERRKIQEISTENESSTQNKKANKRKSDDIGKWKNLSCSQSKILRNDKTQVTESTAKPKLREDLNINTKANNNKTESKLKVVLPPGFKVTKDKNINADNPKEENDNITVFVSNLDYTATEEEVRCALKPAGPITLIRMIKDYKGRSKGYCYVQLSSAVCIIYSTINTNLK